RNLEATRRSAERRAMATSTLAAPRPLQPASTPERPVISPLVVWGTRMLDDAYRIPGTSVRVGLDGLIGLIPGVGDLLTAGFGYFMLREAKRLGVPALTRARM